MHVAEQLGRRRLAVRPGDRDDLVGQQAPAELELAEHREAAGARGGDDRRLARHPGALAHGAHAARCAEAVGRRVDRDAERLELGCDRVADGRGVDADDLLAAGAQRAGRGHAGPREADDEPGAGRQRRPPVTPAGRGRLT